MIKLDKFNELLSGAVSVPVHTDEVPQGADTPAIGWEHNGLISDNGASRDMGGFGTPRTNSWRLTIVTKRISEQMAVLNELALLDNSKSDDFQDISIVFFDGGKKGAPNGLRYAVMDIETVDASSPELHENQGVMAMSVGDHLTFAEPVSIYPSDQITFEYVAEAGSRDIMSANEAETILYVEDGQLVSIGDYTWTTLTGNGLTLDGHRGRISGVYQGITEAKLWAPLTGLPIFNFEIKRGGIAKQLGLGDIFIPLDDRLYDVNGGNISVTLED